MGGIARKTRPSPPCPRRLRSYSPTLHTPTTTMHSHCIAPRHTPPSHHAPHHDTHRPHSTRLTTPPTQALRDDLIDAVYDVTVKYSRECGVLGLLLRGTEVRVDVRRYAVGSLPRDADGLGEWLVARWVEKDARLRGLVSGCPQADVVRAEPYRWVSSGLTYRAMRAAAAARVAADRATANHATTNHAATNCSAMNSSSTDCSSTNCVTANCPPTDCTVTGHSTQQQQQQQQQEESAPAGQKVRAKTD